MSSDRVEITEPVAAQLEPLAERMARSPLSLLEALRCATEIAAALRDLHHHGLAYGAVSSQLIEISAMGASLRPTGGLKRLADGRGDVAAFGAVLEEMLQRPDTNGEGLEHLREQARALALRCREESPDMQQVLIGLRLLGLQARQHGSTVRPVVAVRRVAVPSKPGMRDRIRTALHWKPLANLATFASSGK